MLAEAETLLREGRAEDALPIALHALETIQQQPARPDTTTATTTTAALPFLNTIAEIYLELGSAPTARTYFLRAVSLDPTGLIPSTLGGGADKFLQLAQLSSQGGEDSVSWFSRGAAILRQEIGSLGKGEGEREEGDDDGQEEGPTSKRKKLANALCGIIEVYMTDLSWDPNAEAQCESLIAEALLVAPSCPEPLQTLASIRISQGRIAEARDALRESVAMWGGLEVEDDGDDDGEDGDGAAVPDFATRVSLARLLMEVGMEEEALGVVERLVLEDDGSVEAWYLGGWCLYLLGVKRGEGGGDDDGMEDVNGDEEAEGKGEEDLYTESMVSSREWLRQSLNLYELVEYEDERLRDHARELVAELDAIIGERGEVEVEEEEEWDGFGEESDEEEQEDETMDEG